MISIREVTDMMTDIKGKLGFGMMRLPMKEGEVDVEQTCAMVDAFLAAGFCYFDTAHGYIDGKSELAVRDCLVLRHPRESFLLADKLSPGTFHREEDVRPMIEEELSLCGVSYFDLLLVHCQNAELFEQYKAAKAYETAFAMKEESKVRHVGISFHDKAEVLDRIISEYPALEVIQIQFNYLDYEDEGVEARKCYEVCRKHGKQIVVMEPVKGGSLANLPAAARAVFEEIGDASPASYAIRFAAGFEGVVNVLSGMSNMAQMEDNLGFMKDFRPLDEVESAAVARVTDILKSAELIRCTACRYCVAGCPRGIAIPEIFARLNAVRYHLPYEGEVALSSAADCVECGACEAACPQKLPIRALLKQAAGESK